jgi:hypothetical protein
VGLGVGAERPPRVNENELFSWESSLFLGKVGGGIRSRT